jgi:phosphoglycerate dehydrogenase-like enzyme
MTVLIAIYSPFLSWCIPESSVEWLRRTFPEHRFVRADTDEAAQTAIADADAAFSSQIKPAHVAAAPRLRWIHSPAAGVGSMLFPEMLQRDIVMTNSRGVSAVTIAEHTVAVTLALLRGLPLAWRRQAERAWAQNEFNAGALIRTLRGASVLIVGLGAIGSETARLMAALGAKVTGVRRHPEHPRPDGVATVIGPNALGEYLPAADVVILSAPQTSETVNLIGARELSLMKPDAVLVNVSRGKLIDEPALVAALERGQLRGAALDVFAHEPLSPDSPLWTSRDVLITPHVSGFHADYWPSVTRLFADNLRRFIERRPLINVVDKRAGY